MSSVSVWVGNCEVFRNTTVVHVLVVSVHLYSHDDDDDDWCLRNWVSNSISNADSHTHAHSYTFHGRRIVRPIQKSLPLLFGQYSIPASHWWLWRQRRLTVSSASVNHQSIRDTVPSKATHWLEGRRLKYLLTVCPICVEYCSSAAMVVGCCGKIKKVKFFHFYVPPMRFGFGFRFRLRT